MNDMRSTRQVIAVSAMVCGSVLLLTVFIDGDGKSFIPRDAAREIGAASSAPVYAPYDTYIGGGIVGGYVDTLPGVGIAAADMTPQQRTQLMKVVGIYTSKMSDEIAAERMAKLQKAGTEKITFAWAGEAERGKRHYYRIQGPTFLIEHDNSQNDGNHVHSVWRDFNGDFGRDLLREHIASVPH